MTYEYKFRKRQSLKVDGGYKFNAITYSPVGLDMLAEPDGISSYAHKAIYAGLGYNYFFFTTQSGKFQNYISASFNYRYSYNDLIRNDDKIADDLYVYTYQSTYASRYELKLLVGFRKLSAIKLHKPSAFFEWFLGAAMSKETIYGNHYIDKWRHEPSAFHYWKNNARVCFGFKLGIAWKRHKNIW